MAYSLAALQFFVCFNCVKGFANLCPCGGNQCETLLSHVKLIKHEQMKKHIRWTAFLCFHQGFTDSPNKLLQLTSLGIALLQIIVFFGLAIGLGQVVKASNIVEAVDWGRLSFMKPDTARGWFFMGICTLTPMSNRTSWTWERHQIQDHHNPLKLMNVKRKSLDFRASDLILNGEIFSPLIENIPISWKGGHGQYDNFIPSLVVCFFWIVGKGTSVAWMEVSNKKHKQPESYSWTMNQNIHGSTTKVQHTKVRKHVLSQHED